MDLPIFEPDVVRERGPSLSPILFEDCLLFLLLICDPICQRPRNEPGKSEILQLILLAVLVLCSINLYDVNTKLPFLLDGLWQHERMALVYSSPKNKLRCMWQLPRSYHLGGRQ